MLPVIPTTSGSNRRRQAGGDGVRARAAGRRPGRRDVAQRVERRLVGGPGRADEQRRGAGRPPGRGSGGRRCARPASATNRQPGVDEPGVDGTAADRAGDRDRGAGSRPAGRPRRGRRRSSGPGSGGVARVALGRVGNGDRPWSVTGRVSHRARVTRAADGRSGDRRGVGSGTRSGRRDRVVGDPPEQLERHHRHLEVAEADDRRRALLDPHRDHEVRLALLPPDEADERVVEEVDLPAPASARPRSGPCPVLPPTS